MPAPSRPAQDAADSLLTLITSLLEDASELVAAADRDLRVGTLAGLCADLALFSAAAARAAGGGTADTVEHVT